MKRSNKRSYFERDTESVYFVAELISTGDMHLVNREVVRRHPNKEIFWMGICRQKVLPRSLQHDVDYTKYEWLDKTFTRYMPFEPYVWSQEPIRMTLKQALIFSYEKWHDLKEKGELQKKVRNKEIVISEWEKPGLYDASVNLHNKQPIINERIYLNLKKQK